VTIQDTVVSAWYWRLPTSGNPGYEQRLESSRRGDAAEFVPAGRLIPDWPGK